MNEHYDFSKASKGLDIEPVDIELTSDIWSFRGISGSNPEGLHEASTSQPSITRRPEREFCDLYGIDDWLTGEDGGHMVRDGATPALRQNDARS